MVMSDQEIRQMKNKATEDVKKVLEELEHDYPGVTEGAASLIGAGAGAVGSLWALTTLGTTGLSAAGITSGLATAGGFVGGGMVAGIGVLAAPIVLVGVFGYHLAKKHKNAKLAVALGVAINQLYDVQNRLMQNAEYFKDELAGIKATIELLKKKQKV